MARLVFRAKTPASPHLVFRPRPHYTATLSATVPGVRADFAGTYRYHAGSAGLAAIVPGVRADLRGRYLLGTAALAALPPGVAADLAGEYYPRVWRGLSAMSRAGLARSTRLEAARGLPFRRALPLHQAADFALSPAAQTGHAAALVWGHGDRLAVHADIAWGEASRIGAALAVEWARTEPLAAAATFALGPAAPLDTAAAAVWAPTTRFQASYRLPWGGAAPLATVLIVPWRPGQGLTAWRDMPWRPGQAPAHGTRPKVPPIVPPVAPYVPSAHLVFRGRRPASTHLVFRRTGRTRALPNLEFYTVHNSAYVKRVADGLSIECKSVRISGDWQSWGRRFSGEVGWADRAKLDLTNGPVEIEIGANGQTWRAWVTKVRPMRKFGQDSLSFDGVSLSAELAAPYAAPRSRTTMESLTAQQIALQELDGTGWSLDWRIVDWTVPAGAYSVQHMTPMQALQRIVEAVGGYLQTHPTARILRVLKQYPVLPWHWGAATPDVAVPVAALQSLGTDWQEKPAYEGVYVSGQGHGVNALVLRDGAAGSVLAPMVVDALLTEPDANRARGEAILADTGVQSVESTALALDETLGVIEPGALIRVSDTDPWTALCRSCELDISWTEPGGLVIWQTLSLERHYGG